VTDEQLAAIEWRIGTHDRRDAEEDARALLAEVRRLRAEVAGLRAELERIHDDSPARDE
jgi:hypothetical protein